MKTKSDYPVMFFEKSEKWQTWLAANHTTADGVWLKFAKKGSGVESLNYAGALDVALCYGWIDGQAKSIDETYYQQKFTPRRAKSMWSKRNIDKVAVLIADSRMQPAGYAAIEEAKKNGRWDGAYDGPKNMQVPAELAAALKANPEANAFFETLNKTNRYAFCWRVATALKPETKQARVQKMIAMLKDGETFH